MYRESESAAEERRGTGRRRSASRLPYPSARSGRDACVGNFFRLIANLGYARQRNNLYPFRFTVTLIPERRRVFLYPLALNATKVGSESKRSEMESKKEENIWPRRAARTSWSRTIPQSTPSACASSRRRLVGSCPSRNFTVFARGTFEFVCSRSLGNTLRRCDDATPTIAAHRIDGWMMEPADGTST